MAEPSDLVRKAVEGFDGTNTERYDPVQVVTVYQVSCRICGAANVEETYEEYGDAEDARDFHRKIHRGEV